MANYFEQKRKSVEKKVKPMVEKVKEHVGSRIGGKSATDRIQGAIEGALIGAQVGGVPGGIAGFVGGAAGGKSGIDDTKKRIGDKIDASEIGKVGRSITGETSRKHKKQEEERKAAETAKKLDEAANVDDINVALEKARQAGTGAPASASAGLTTKIDPTLIAKDAVADVTAGKAGKIEAERIARGDVADVTAGTTREALAAQLKRSDIADIQAGKIAPSEFRGTQQELLQALQAQAAGTAPSIAEMQAKRSGERALAQQLAMAAGATGSQASLARRQAARGQAQIGADIAATAAEARLAEQRSAQEQIGQVTSAARQQDIAVETTQQDADLRAQMQNQGVDLDVFKTNLESTNKVALANLAIRQADRDAKLRADMANQGVDLDVVKQNAAAGNAAALANLKAETADLDRELKAAMGNQTVEFDIIKTNAAANNTAAIANVEAALKKAGLDDAMTVAYMQNELGLTKIEVDAALGKAKIAADMALGEAQIQAAKDTAALQAKSAEKAAGYGAIANLGVGVVAKYSDVNLKKNIKKRNIGEVLAGDKLTDFLDNLETYNYNYKDEKHGEGDQTSIMAQDLEKSEIGKKAVIETPEGKMVDYSKLLPAMLAASVDTHKRISGLEKALVAKKKQSKKDK
jgi:hypothetical protein